MSYHSQVAIAIDSKVFENTPDKVKEAFNAVFTAPTAFDEHRVLFHELSLKWYGDYPIDSNVEIITEYLDTLNDEDYGMIVLSEDEDEIFVGNPWKFGIHYNLYIDFK